MQATPPSPTILLVDDDPLFTQAFARRTLGLLSCITAHSAKEAIRILEAPPRPILAICSDWMMPMVDGAALLGVAREISPTTLRYLFTGKIDHEKLAKVKSDQTIERVFLKPLDPIAVINAIREDKSRSRARWWFFGP